MFDATYQSVICYWVVHLLFAPGIFVTSQGQDLGDRNRMGVYVACGAVVVVNVYVLLNSYRWDWLLVLMTVLSILLVFFWTGVWSANDSFAEFFYQAGTQVFQQPSFWAITALMIVACLLPRFVQKFIQKVYFPYDVDIIREQVRQGKFDYLDDPNAKGPPQSAGNSATSNEEDDFAKPSKHILPFDDDTRPLKAPSVAPTYRTTHNARSQNGSDGTDYTRHRFSLQPPDEEPGAMPSNYGHSGRQSVDRARPSFDRMRQSMDRMRPSFEQSNDLTSAAMLTRLESSVSFGPIRSRNSRFNDQGPPGTPPGQAR